MEVLSEAAQRVHPQRGRNLQQACLFEGCVIYGINMPKIALVSCSLYVPGMTHPLLLPGNR